jgi:hypothetical protein
VFFHEGLHRAFELQFWGTVSSDRLITICNTFCLVNLSILRAVWYDCTLQKMNISGSQYSVDELSRTKGEMEAFLADEEKLLKTRELLKDLPEDSDHAKTLKMFVSYY